MTRPLNPLEPPLCPLCRGAGSEPFHRSDRRKPVRIYLRCDDCGLVHVPPSQRVSAQEEKARYDLHDNDPADAGYRRFLARLAEPLLKRLSAPSEGLDFGCGPTSVLADMLRGDGHHVVVYDPFYAREPGPLEGRYDFITLTEVVEHLHTPGEELRRLWGLLRPGGLLALMTQLLPAAEDFASWHYISDPTHVCFFGDRSIAWLGEELGATPEVLPGGVVFMRRGHTPNTR